MSLAIGVDNVSAVLLADGWHDVEDRSFSLDSYEFKWGDSILHSGGESGICAVGFEFSTTDGAKIAGPLTSVVAVRYEA